MSYSTERSAIECYFQAKWGEETPIGFDGQTFKRVADSVVLMIQSGARVDGSTGRVKNRIDHVGNLVIEINTDGLKGSDPGREYAETIIGFLHEKTLDNTGKVITATADAFVRFSPPQLSGNRHPYISASFKDMPLHVTNVIAPFVRYEYV